MMILDIGLLFQAILLSPVLRNMRGMVVAAAWPTRCWALAASENLCPPYFGSNKNQNSI